MEPWIPWIVSTAVVLLVAAHMSVSLLWDLRKRMKRLERLLEGDDETTKRETGG